MRISRLFLARELSLNASLELDTESSHYLTRVLRLKERAIVTVFNGQGGEYSAQLISADSKQSVLQLKTFLDHNNQSPLTIHLGQVISRSKRMDYVVQKATELGVTEITPLISERCDVRLDDQKAAKRSQHWQQIIINSCQQCGRNLLPTLNSLTSLSNWLEHSSAQVKLILQPGGESLWLQEDSSKPESVTLLIGPEGGFSSNEIELAASKGFQAISLGPRILRTETAPIAALSVLQFLWGDMISK